MKCAIEGCSYPTAGKSKYCLVHKREARARWKVMIGERAAEATARTERYAAAVAKAEAAGMAALTACVPAPMVVEHHQNQLDDKSPVEHAYFVPSGVCGFAWVNVRPGNHPLANYLKKHKGAGKAYEGGVQVWVSEGGQSMERKEAYARAYAQTLRAELQDNAVRIHARSRMD